MKLLIIAIVLNFFSTWYFGWNMHPESEWEHFFDHLTLVLMTLGIAQTMWRKDMKDGKDKKVKAL
jgi:hypothetical protein